MTIIQALEGIFFIYFFRSVIFLLNTEMFNQKIKNYEKNFIFAPRAHELSGAVLL